MKIPNSIPDSQPTFLFKNDSSWEQEKLVSLNESCCLLDIQAVDKMVSVWKDHLPQVEMFHKVKSNSDPRLLSDLFDMGVRFQLTTKKDFFVLESAGISASDSILINSAKMNSLIKEAKKAHVPFLSFDCENELIKIAEFHPDAELLLDLSSFKFPEGEYYDLAESCEKILELGKSCGHVMKLLHLGSIVCDRPQVFKHFSAALSKILDNRFMNYRITANTTEFHFGEPLSILTHVMSTEKSLDGTIRAQVDAKLNSFSTEASPTVITKSANRRSYPINFHGADHVISSELFPEVYPGDLLLWNLSELQWSSKFPLHYLNDKKMN
ncbi:unnamed protein product [Oikopleura dioica]|uniref:Orn/DAP/Arg decarboxylase 2 N-terminal domain-containing protein n=1 Tax=Oikopleura dioica TaxID=34765 RepID=E4XSB4_OIKDI|nr:unnamed protein product [Oikopleura dioica]